MRENRTSGSEGGAAEANRPFLPLSVGGGQWAENHSLDLMVGPARHAILGYGGKSIFPHHRAITVRAGP